MHAISSYRGNRPTNKQTHKQTHKQTGPITIHRASLSLFSAQCKYVGSFFPNIVNKASDQFDALDIVRCGVAHVAVECRSLFDLC